MLSCCCHSHLNPDYGFALFDQRADLIEPGDLCFPSKKWQPSDKNTDYFLYGSGFLQFDIIDTSNALGRVFFKFRSSSSNGLLLFGADPNYKTNSDQLFHAFELLSGRIVYSYNVGFGVVRLTSSRFYDTDETVQLEKTSSHMDDRFTLKLIDSQGIAEEMANDKPYYPGKNYRVLKHVDVESVFMGGVLNQQLLRDYNV